MNKHWEEFQTIYPLLNKEAKDFIDSEKIPNLAQEIIEKESLSTESTKLIIIAVTNYYLRIVPEYKLPEELVESGINEEKVLDITKAITSSLKPIDKSIIESNENENSSNQEKNSVESGSVGNRPASKKRVQQTEGRDEEKQVEPDLLVGQKENLLNEIEEAEAKLASIQPIRTMQNDYQNSKQGTGTDTNTATNPSDTNKTDQKSVDQDNKTKKEDEEAVHKTSQDDLLRESQYADLAPKQEKSPRWESDDS